MVDPHDSNTPQPMSDADIETPPAETEFQPAAPLKDAGVEFEVQPSDAQTGSQSASDATKTTGDTATQTASGATGAKQAVLEGTASLRGQASDKARDFADQGKARATDALGQLSQMLTDAAGQVDEKLGEQYGQYARSAADKVQTFSSTIDQKSVDELLDDARAIVRKSPAVAVGAAAAVGFVVARLITAGIDQRGA